MNRQQRRRRVRLRKRRLYRRALYEKEQLSEHTRFRGGRDGTIYVASTSGVCRVRSGLLVPYSNPYITGETAYALGIDRYGRLWCAMSTGKCAVMQDDRVLAMLDAELFFEDGSVISCLT